jgi:cell division protease FtsH
MVAVNHLRAALKGSGISSGEFKETLSNGGGGGVRLADVLGCDEAKAELRQVLDFIAHPAKFASLGATIPKGILLVGPPGCGKTLIAKAVAGEAGVPFISLSGSDFTGEYAGVGTAKVKRLFAAARKHGKCIIFIDEIDTLGRRRSGGDSALAMDSESTLNQLLVEMDGFDQKNAAGPKAQSRFFGWSGSNSGSSSNYNNNNNNGGGCGILVLAGTNRRDMLDPALTRAGRFDRVVNVDPPDVHGRAQLFHRYMQHLPLAAFEGHAGAGAAAAQAAAALGSAGSRGGGGAAGNATEAADRNRALYATAVAQMTPGFTGAQAATLCNEVTSSKLLESRKRAPISISLFFSSSH